MYLKTLTSLLFIIKICTAFDDTQKVFERFNTTELDFQELDDSTQSDVQGYGTIQPFASCEPTDCNISWDSPNGVIYALAEDAWDGTKIWATGKHSLRCSLGTLEQFFGRAQFKNAENTFIKTKGDKHMLSQRCFHGPGYHNDCLAYWFDTGLVYRPTVNGVPGGRVNAFHITNECKRTCSNKTKTMTYCKVKTGDTYLRSRPRNSCGNGDLFGLSGDGFVYFALGTSNCMK